MHVGGMVRSLYSRRNGLLFGGVAVARFIHTLLLYKPIVWWCARGIQDKRHYSWKLFLNLPLVVFHFDFVFQDYRMNCSFYCCVGNLCCVWMNR